jgi:hypothetical protein
MTTPRHHYITLCARGNIVVTYRMINDKTEVTFEQAKYKGFNTLVSDIYGNIISNDGYNDSDIEFLLSFLEQNKNCIMELMKQDA